MRCTSEQTPERPKKAVAALWGGNKIKAIKLVRLQRNIGLKQSKDQMEAYLLSQPALQRKMDEAQGSAREG